MSITIAIIQYKTCFFKWEEHDKSYAVYFNFKYHNTGCKNLIPMLFWIQDEIYSPCDYIQPIITSYGLCYSINMIPHHHLLHDNYLQS